MVVKAALRLVLMANDTVVAESEDPALWQKVLFAINSGGRPTPELGSVADTDDHQAPDNGLESDVAVARLAQDIGVSVTEIKGACDPRTEVPYLTLDPRYWEALKRNTPARGRGSISPMALAATLIALWFRAAKLGSPTQAQAKAVLDTMDQEDKNPSRAIKISDWLQQKPGGGIALNPARITRATQLARAFCLQEPLNEQGD